METTFMGNYRILKKVGTGGMAKVYLAVHKLVPNLKVILKVLDNPRLEKRFKQEADKLALLEGHPNICRIKDFFVHEDQFVIAMEYIEGHTLLDSIDVYERIPVDQSIKIIQTILETLKFAHKHGIYHRDIKPNNIMIDNNSVVKIIDFGIAKGERDPNLTVAGGVCGTPPYMAPEQFTPYESINFALIDIYAVGITLYFMVTGELPFKDDTEETIREAKLNKIPKSPKELNPNVPDYLDKIIIKAIETNPKNRYHSVEEMLEAINKVSIKTKKPDLIDKPTVALKSQLAKEKPFKPRPRFIYLSLAILLLIIAYFYPFDENKMSKTPALNSKADTVELSNAQSSVKDVKENLGLEETYLKPDTLPVSPAIKPTGTIEIAITPEGDLYIDDSLLGADIKKLSFSLDTGKHTTRIVNDNATNSPIVEEIFVATGKTIKKEYSFQIPEKQINEINQEGLVNVIIGSIPIGASINIDGKLQSEVTNYTFQLKPGMHIITAKLAGYDEQVDTVQVVAGNKTIKKTFYFLEKP